MPIKSKDIKGFLVEKVERLQRSIDSADPSKQDKVIKDLRRQIKEIVKLVKGERSIGLNFGKLVQNIINVKLDFPDTLSPEAVLNIARHIISKEEELLEVKL